MKAISTWDWVTLMIGTLAIILASGGLLGTWGFLLGAGISFCLFAVYSLLQSIKTLLWVMRQVQMNNPKKDYS